MLATHKLSRLGAPRYVTKDEISIKFCSLINFVNSLTKICAYWHDTQLCDVPTDAEESS